ncbi:MAG: hypothetical protein AB1641_05685 [Thermodesulfobacteriota bacterium]
MIKRLLPVLAILLLLGVFIGRAPAADKPQPELKLDKVEVAAYGELKVMKGASDFGLVEAFSQEGKVLVSISLEVYPQWTEAIDSAQVNAKDIKLKTDQGEDASMIGRFERFGEFRLENSSLYAYRRSDWKEKKEPTYFNAVFAVPKAVKAGEFKLGQASAKITVPDKIQDPPDAAGTLKVEVIGAALVDKVRSTYRVGDLKPRPATVITNPNGQILEVKIKVTPVKGNSGGQNHYFWYTPWFGLLTETNRYVRVLGEMFMEGINNAVSHNLNRGSDGQWSSGEATLYFAVPKGVKKFKLIYLGQAVAEAAL